MPASEIPAHSPVWEPVAHALAQLPQAMLLATAPNRVLVGGGVMEHRTQLLVRVREMFVASVNGYLDLDDLTGGIGHYLRAPGPGSLAGPLGALALATLCGLAGLHLPVDNSLNTLESIRSSSRIETLTVGTLDMTPSAGAPEGSI
jgi:predicted NBD/HSP70 family sugar kinase